MDELKKDICPCGNEKEDKRLPVCMDCYHSRKCGRCDKPIGHHPDDHEYCYKCFIELKKQGCI